MSIYVPMCAQGTALRFLSWSNEKDNEDDACPMVASQPRLKAVRIETGGIEGEDYKQKMNKATEEDAVLPFRPAFLCPHPLGICANR